VFNQIQLKCHLEARNIGFEPVANRMIVDSGVMDLLLAGFPIVLLLPLKIERREKIGVCVAMSLGVFAGVAAFIKSSYLPQIGRWQDLTCKPSCTLHTSLIPNISADSCYVLLIWAAAETSITIVATSIPYLRLAFRERGRSSRGYQVEDEVHMDNIIQNSRVTWTVEGGYNRTAPLPPLSKKGSVGKHQGSVVSGHRVHNSWNP